MKHKTWFRLVLKAIGILIVCLNLPDLIYQIIYLCTRWQQSDPLSSGPTDGDLIAQLTWPISSSLGCALGAYLLFGGKWLVDLCIPSNRPYCPGCGYELSNSTTAICPECGERLHRDEAT
jgi:hypothetical protein